MAETIDLGGIPVEVVRKKIRNLHLSVRPPDGKVRVSVPLRMKLDMIRTFTLSKLGWIRRQQRKLRDQERETPRDYLDRESHHVWGKRCLLRLIEQDAAPEVWLGHDRLILRVRPGTNRDKKQALVAAWYREEIRKAASPLIGKWEPLIGVKVKKLFVQHMKTRWGTCNQRAGNIRLNSELAKKPPELLEYIVVHEMVHLLEPAHGPRFVSLMDTYLPGWRFCRERLNRLPLSHAEWPE